jgi:hypothetical protein
MNFIIIFAFQLSDEFLDPNSSGEFVEPSNSSNSNDSIMTIPAQLTPGNFSASTDHWDPREAAERPTFAKGIKPAGKTVPAVLARKQQMPMGSSQRNMPAAFSPEQQHHKQESNLDKVAGPSSLLFHTIILNLTLICTYPIFPYTVCIIFSSQTLGHGSRQAATVGAAATSPPTATTTTVTNRSCFCCLLSTSQQQRHRAALQVPGNHCDHTETGNKQRQQQ